jgi:hypothetical protein
VFGIVDLQAPSNVGGYRHLFRVRASLACQFLLGHLHSCCPAGFFLAAAAAAAAGHADCLTCRLQPVKDVFEFAVSCSALPIELW